MVRRPLLRNFSRPPPGSMETVRIRPAPLPSEKIETGRMLNESYRNMKYINISILATKAGFYIFGKIKKMDILESGCFRKL